MHSLDISHIFILASYPSAIPKIDIPPKLESEGRNQAPHVPSQRNRDDRNPLNTADSREPTVTLWASCPIPTDQAVRNVICVARSSPLSAKVMNCYSKMTLPTYKPRESAHQFMFPLLEHEPVLYARAAAYGFPEAQFV